MKISNFKFLDYYKKDFPQDGKFSQEDIDILFYYKTTDFSEIHTHNYWEIMVMCENSLINSLDGREVVMSGFDMCLVKPENVHLIKKYKQNTMKYYNFEIRARKNVPGHVLGHSGEEVFSEDAIPSGSLLRAVSTDEESYVILENMDTGELIRVDINGDGWPHTIEGKAIEEYFEGLIFAG